VRSHKRPRLTVRDIAVLAGLGFAGLAIVAALVGANVRLSSLAPGGRDFFLAWTGARAFLFGNEDPYGSASAVAAQELTYGGAPTNSVDPYRLNLPFYLLPFFFPFALITDPAVARGVWAFLGQAALVGAIFLSLDVVEWRASRLFVVVFSLLVVFSFHSVAALAEGTPTILLTLGYMGVLWAIRTEHDELAGALIVLCLCMWEVVLPFLVLVSWRVLHERRWRIVAGFGMTLTILPALSFLLYPGWLLPFLTASMGMIRSAYGISMPAVLARLLPQYGSQIAKGVTIVVLSTLIYEWAVGRDSDFRRFVWIACLALAVTPLIGIRTEIVNLVALLPSFVLVSAAALQRRRPGAWLGILFLVLAFAVPWLLFWRQFAFDDQRAQDLLFLFLPCISVLGMYWTRWWFLRPARTWLDEVRAAGR